MEKNVPARQIVIGVLLMGILLAVNAGFALPARADWHSLTGLLPAHVGNVDFQISPDSQFVVYTADADSDDVDELYSVPISGTTPIKLNPPLVEDGDIDRFAITPDSQYVIYIADQEVDNRKELYRVPIGGGAAVKLNPELVVGGNIQSLQIDPENQYVVYGGDQQLNDVFELWSVPILGGTSVRLNGAMGQGGDISQFKFDPLSNRIVYNADQEVDGRYELFSVPIGGGTATKLNPPIVLSGGGDSGISNFQINPVIPVVVFLAREATATGFSKELYMVPTAGGIPALKISVPLASVQSVYHFGISPAGDRVVYIIATRESGGPQGSDKGTLVSTLIGGGNEVVLTEAAVPYYGTDDIFFTPDGSRVVYEFQGAATQTPRLQSSTVQSGVRATLYAPTPSDPALSFFRLSQDSQWVIYHTVGTPFGDLYTVPSGGGNSIRHGFGQLLATTPDSGRILYRSVTGDTQQTDMFSAQIFGGGVRDLSGMEGTGYIGETRVSADGNRIVFLIQIDSQYDLRVSDGLPAQPPVTPTPTVTLTPTANPTVSPTPTVPTVPLLHLYLPMTQKS